MRLLILSIFILYVPFSFSNWFSEPKSYDDCVLEYMKGTTSDLAAKAIHRSCRNKFPLPAPKQINLNSAELSKITGTAQVSGKYVNLNIYNGSSLYVNKIYIRITDKSTKKYQDYVATQTSRLGSFPVSPLSTGKFSFSVLTIPKNWSWTIVSAAGMKS